jgi:ELWxxDGT repeat protein
MKKIILLVLLSAISSSAQYNFEQLSISSGSASALPRYLTLFNNEMYFSARTSQFSEELWKTNGTAAGTIQVADINPGFQGSSPESFKEFNGSLYFIANVFQTTGRELYRTNGTTTTIVKDINVGVEDSFDQGTNAHKLIVLNSKLYFLARENSNGYDLWRTDGTTAGTQKMVDLDSFGLGTSEYFFESNGELFFVMDDNNESTIGSELYKYNETTNTVTLVKDINSGNGNTSMIHIGNITNFDNKLFFSAEGGFGVKLYVTDGTFDGTYAVDNVVPINYLNPRKLFVYNNELYFIATKTGVGTDLYKCKKNINNVYEIELVYNFNANGNNILNPFLISGVFDYIIYNNELHFVAREQSSPNNGNIYQIYKTNGTTTQIAYNITVADVGATSENRISNFTIFNGKLFFMMNGINMPNDQLCVVNNNGTITRLTNYSGPVTQPQGLRVDVMPVVFNNNLYFTATTLSAGDELWKMTDTTLSNANNDFKAINSKIYPNPTRNFVNIDIENTNNFEVELHDILGKKLNTFLNQKIIDISQFTKGIYILKINNKDNNQVQYSKIIKE